MPTPGDQPGPGNPRGNSNATRVLDLKLELKKIPQVSNLPLT